YLEPQPVVEEAGVKTDLPFRGFLRLQVDITGATDCNRRHRFALDRCNRRAEELLRRAEARHQTRAAPRATEAQRRKGIGLREEVYLTDHPGTTQRGIPLEPELLTEVAAAVTTDAGRDEHTVAPSKLLRAEDTERALSAIALAYAEALARATERAGAWQEPETTRTDPLPALLSDLTADCRRRRQLGVELERANRTRATRVHATQSRNDRPVAHGIIRVDRGRPDAGVDMGDILGIVH